MSGAMRCYQLEAAIIGAVALDKSGAALARAMPRIPAAPSLPRLPSVPRLPALGHALSRFVRRESGLYVPAAPALIGRASPVPLPGSGPIPSRSRVGWSDAIDMAGIVAFWRRVHGPAKTAEQVAARTGEPLSTVRKWFAGETRPSFRATLVCVCEYGPPLLEAGLTRHPGWFSEILAATDRIQLAGELALVRARIDQVLGVGAEVPA